MDDENIKFAVLITCYNRKEKTLNCIKSLYQSIYPDNYSFEVFLVDDGSTDGTSVAIKERFTQVNIVKGSGNLFWAGGMRLAWKTALSTNEYDAFLLLNDDVVLVNDFFLKLIEAIKYTKQNNQADGIYCATTIDKNTNKVTYGGLQILVNGLYLKTKRLQILDKPQYCQIANANILLISNNVVKSIGIFDEKYTHGIADYDFTYNAHKKGFPIVLASGYGGYCSDDHGNNWRGIDLSLTKRIEYLKSAKGLAYNEYLYYIAKNFPLFYPYSFIMLWVKTLFPFLWELKSKKNKI